MSNYYYPVVNPYLQPTYSASNLIEMGKVGATVGLCGAGAANLHRLKREEINRADALIDTLKVGLASGVATAAAGWAASQFRTTPLLSTAATLATGTAVMYLLSKEKTDEQ